jgi:2-oxoglutarate ferredoxin oxidoreductase subunit delta
MDQEDKAQAVRPEDCVVCKLCEMRCPDLAIEVVAEEEAEEDIG